MAYTDHLMMAIIIGGLSGVATRVYMLQTDYRQYPTYPHGWVIHLALGVIAAALGAVAVPALVQKDFTAVTFLTLAAQQFRDIRNMEREMLSKLDEMELVPRGGSYIEGIAMVFEGRNYLTITSALVTSFFTVIWDSIIGVIVGIAMVFVSSRLMSGKTIEQIAEIEVTPLHMKGPNLYVGSIYLMNIGLKDNRQRILEKGIGVILKPKNASSRITLGNVGQRQAILHDVSCVLGVYRDTGEPALTPIAKLDLGDGRLGLLLLPQEHDIEKAKKVIARVPVLESALRKPFQLSNARGGKVGG